MFLEKRKKKTAEYKQTNTRSGSIHPAAHTRQRFFAQTYLALRAASAAGACSGVPANWRITKGTCAASASFTSAAETSDELLGIVLCAPHSLRPSVPPPLRPPTPPPLAHFLAHPRTQELTNSLSVNVQPQSLTQTNKKPKNKKTTSPPGAHRALARTRTHALLSQLTNLSD